MRRICRICTQTVCGRNKQMEEQTAPKKKKQTGWIIGVVVMSVLTFVMLAIDVVLIAL